MNNKMVKSQEMFVYQWFIDLDTYYNTVIRIYGINDEQKTICLKVINFKPYCFIELPNTQSETVTEIQTLVKQFCLFHEFVKGEHLYNSHNVVQLKENSLTKKKTSFMKIYFKNKKKIQDMVYFLQSKHITVNGVKHKLAVHENNANPVLQLICNCKIDSVGWLNFNNRGTAKLVDDMDKETVCDEEYTVRWETLTKGRNVNNVQPKIMAFDIEVTSSVPNAFPSNLPGDEIFQISCVVTTHNSTKKILLSLQPVNDQDMMVKTLATEDIKTVLCNSEEHLLKSFIQLVDEEKPNIMTGFNIFGFDIEYIIKRCRRFLLIDRLKSAGFCKNSLAKEEEIKWSSAAYKNQNFRFINWEGILLVDLLPIIQREYKLDTYTLKNVTSTFLQNNTKDPVTHKDIFEAFNTRDSNLLSVVGKYCVQDSSLCIELMNTLHTWVNLCEMARCCSVPIFTIFTQGQQIRLYSQIYRFCTNNNIVVTTNGYTAKTNERYRGALVYEPTPGFYKNVCPLDFTSLYPSIIIGYNLCYSTYIPDNCDIPEEYYNTFEWEDHMGCEHDNNVIQIKQLTNKIESFETKIAYKREKIKNVSQSTLKTLNMTKTKYRAKIQEEINELSLLKKPFIEQRQKLKKSEPKNYEDQHGNKIEGIMCAKRRYRFLKPSVFKGIVPTIIQNLLDSRAAVKEQLKTAVDKQKIVLNMQQLSYKVSANSFYGSFGVVKGYLPFMPCAMTVTFCGREAITNVIDLAVNKFSAKLVMSDTDSTYLIFPDVYKNYQDLWKHAEGVANEITNYKRDNVRLFPEALKLEFENDIYSKFLIVAKKMYLYVAVDINGQESSKIGKKGVVLARRDNSQVVRCAYEQITRLIFDSIPVDELMSFLKQYILNMYAGKFPIEDFVITKSIGSIDENNTDENVKAVGNYKIRKALPENNEDRQKILATTSERDFYISQCPPQVQLAERMQKRGTPVSAGSRIEFVVIKNTKSTSLGQKMECFDYFKKHKNILKLDYNYYATALINPITQLINAVSETPDNKVKNLVKEIIQEKIQEYEDSKPIFVYVK